MPINKFGVALKSHHESNEISDAKFMKIIRRLEKERVLLQHNFDKVIGEIRDRDLPRIQSDLSIVKDSLARDGTDVVQQVYTRLLTNVDFIQEISSKVNTAFDELEGEVHNLAEKIDSVDSEISKRIEELGDRVYKLEKA